MKNNCETLYAFANGDKVALNKVKDEVFSTYTLGKGIAIKPRENILYSPCNGKISTIADTCHAITMTSDGGAEILIHVGIDTVELGGTFFEAKVAEGKTVKKGDKLIEFQREKIEYEGYDTTICMVICNTDSYKRLEMSEKASLTIDDIAIVTCR